VDDDWKAEAAREKQKLAEETKDVGRKGPLPDPVFAEIVNMIVMQVLVALGGMNTPDGQQIPPDLNVAKHQIDVLGLLAEKTKGNLTDDEQKMLDSTLYELQMRFVQAASPPDGGEGKPSA
ncbi:MAG: DUF1844 domain-containing protein, partial [Phycisphaerales bacterium]